MDGLLKWLTDNWGTLFSGVGVAVIGWIAHLMYRRRQTTSFQKIKSGSNSTNIQAGRDVKINSEFKRSDVGKK